MRGTNQASDAENWSWEPVINDDSHGFSAHIVKRLNQIVS
jgi:hypothetical protein